jgi:hypothetical protein
MCKSYSLPINCAIAAMRIMRNRVFGAKRTVGRTHLISMYYTVVMWFIPYCNQNDALTDVYRYQGICMSLRQWQSRRTLFRQTKWKGIRWRSSILSTWMKGQLAAYYTLAEWNTTDGIGLNHIIRHLWAKCRVQNFYGPYTCTIKCTTVPGKHCQNRECSVDIGSKLIYHLGINEWAK